MPPKVGEGKRKKRATKKKAAPRGRGIFGSLGGVLGGVAGNFMDGMVGGLGKKRRGRGDMVTSISPVTMGLKPGFIQA